MCVLCTLCAGWLIVGWLTCWWVVYFTTKRATFVSLTIAVLQVVWHGQTSPWHLAMGPTFLIRCSVSLFWKMRVNLCNSSKLSMVTITTFHNDILLYFIGILSTHASSAFPAVLNTVISALHHAMTNSDSLETDQSQLCTTAIQGTYRYRYIENTCVDCNEKYKLRMSLMGFIGN